MADLAPGELPGTRNAKGPAAGHSVHSFCQDCNRVIYNIWKHGPITPHQHNRTFCVCGGEQTGVEQQKVMVYGVEDLKNGGK